VTTYSGSVAAGTTQVFSRANSGGQLWALFDTDLYRGRRGFQVHYDIGENFASRGNKILFTHASCIYRKFTSTQ